MLQRGRARRVETLARGLRNLSPTELDALARGVDALERMLASGA
jgi:hypothetical protein